MIDVKRILSLLILHMLFLDIFAPSVYAASTCEVTDMTQMGQELGILYPAKEFWKETLGWTADEFNELSAESLLTASNQTPLTQPGRYSIAQIAGLLGRNPAEVAEELETNDTGMMLTDSEIQALAAKKPGGFLDQFLGTNSKVPTKEEYLSVKMPNGKTIRLKEIYDRMGYDDLRDSCTLDQSYINGKVSFVALLNKDIRVGYIRSIDTLDKGQHLTATDTMFGLNLNGGSSSVLPHTFEKIAIAFGQINSAEMIIGMVMIAASVAKAKKGEVSLSQAKEDKAQAIAKQQNLKGYLGANAEGLDAASSAWGTRSELLKATKSAGAADAIDSLYSSGVLKQTGNNLVAVSIDSTGKQVETVLDSKGLKALILAADKVDVDDTAMAITETYAKKRIAVEAKNGGEAAFTALSDVETSKAAVLKKTVDMENVKLVADAGTFMTLKNFVMGMEWMGPARVGLQMSKSMVMLSPQAEANRKDSYIDVNINKRVGEVYDKVTDFLGLGKLMDLVGSLSGAFMPPKARVKSVFILNTVEGGDTTSIVSDNSITSLSKDGVVLDWRGSSEATFFENFQGDDNTNLAFETNNLNFDSALERREEFSSYFQAIEVVAPLLLMALRPASAVTGPVRGLIFMTINDVYLDNVLNVDAWSQDEKCNENTTDEFINTYLAVTAADVGINILMPYLKVWAVTKATTAMRFAAFAGKASTALTVIDYLNPLSLFQMYYSSKAFEYANNCKDTKYKIMMNQKIPTPTMTMSMSKTISDAAKAINEQLKDTSIGEIIQGMGTNVADYETTEIMNARAYFTDEAGAVFPQQFVYLHLSQANMGWWGVFEKQCFKQTKDGKDKAFIENESGLYVLNKQTGATKKLADSLRVLMEQMNQELGRTIVPNKILTASMNEPGKIVLQVKGDPAKLYGVSSSVATCLSSQLKEITGRAPTGDDLSSILGDVSAVYTTKGRIGFANGLIKFYRFESETVSSGVLNLTKTNYDVGSEVQLPGVEEEGAGTVDIYGDGKVKLSGPISSSVNEKDVGEVLTIITERGKIEYNREEKKLYLALYALATVSGDAIKSINMKPGTAYDAECNKNIQVPYLDKLIGQVGAEEETDAMNKALAKIQEDSKGNAGGMNVLETEDYIYWFTADPPKCEPTLKIFNKKTGLWENHTITGAITMDQDKLVVPTADGDWKFGLSSQNGVPVLSVTNPSGLEQLMALLLARGSNGIFAFDPYSKLWYAMNGQDIPWNSDYTTKGMAFQGSADGLRGYAQNSLISQPYGGTDASTAGAKALLAMPWVPEGWQLILFLTLLLGGLIVVRERYGNVTN